MHEKKKKSLSSLYGATEHHFSPIFFHSLYLYVVPTTHFLHFIHKQDNTTIFLLEDMHSWSSLPYQGNYLPTHTQENLNNVDTPFSIAGSLFDKMDATGIAICWGFSLHYAREHLHAPMWNNSRTWWSRIMRKMSGSTDTRKCEDTQWCWLRFHSGSDVFTRSALYKIRTSWKVSLFVSIKHTWSGPFPPTSMCLFKAHVIRG